jgi:hypothetical protein
MLGGANTTVELASEGINPGLKASRFVLVFRGITPPASSGTTICNRIAKADRSSLLPVRRALRIVNDLMRSVDVTDCAISQTARFRNVFRSRQIVVSFP